MEQEVQDGDAFQPAGDALAVELPSDLPEGGLTATYRAVSADSHPVSGGFSFTVGEGGTGPQAVDRLLEGTDQRAGDGDGPRGRPRREYAAITLAVGTLLFLALCAPAGAREAIAPRVSGALAVASVAGLMASVAGLALHGAQAAGTSVWAFELSFGTQFGRTWLLAAVGWILLLVLRRSGWATLPAGGLCAVPAAGGHASVEGPLMLGANLVHVVGRRGLDRRPGGADLRVPPGNA